MNLILKQPLLRLFVIFILLQNVNYAFSKENLDSLLNLIDKSITESKKYTDIRDRRINQLKENKRFVKPFSQEEYSINSQLFEEYKKYICDSAIHYQHLNIEIAQHLKDNNKENESKIKLAYIMGSTGMYKESIDLLESIDSTKLSKPIMVDYIHTLLYTYSELAFYTQDKQSSDKYWHESGKYEHILKQIVPENSYIYLQLKEDSTRNAHSFDKALKINDEWLSRITKGSEDYAFATFHRSLIYLWQGNLKEHKYYLALSSISDIESAIKDQASLRMLAKILYDEGDIERAYNYIRYSWNATLFYNAKLRTLQTASILSMIDKTYQAKIEKQKSKLQFYLVLTTSLMILLFLALMFIFKQIKRLSMAKAKLQEANQELNKVNNDLFDLNKVLNITNNELSESNKIKEVYIGRFIELCSIYINKIDDFRKKVHIKIKDGKISDAQMLTQSQDIMDEEFEELYLNFDNAFLQLFPDFVDKVNELLNEQDKFILKKGELLNPELRIMALMRLGMNDGAKISQFLRYSLTTVYNYRTKTKNRTYLSKEEFDSKILKIR